MKILVIGGGGREHAIAWKLAQSSRVERVFVAPGNAGTALEEGVENVALAPMDFAAQLQFVETKAIDLTVVGPEAPLVAGISDYYREHGQQPCFGPSRGAAQLEGSKAFSKDFLARHNIPTAAYEVFTETDAALEYLQTVSIPVVIKADGLAAGKGVIVAQTLEQAQSAVTDMLAGNSFGDAGRRVVIEEFMQGEEASFIVMVDGEHILPLASSQDHKARDDGDRGPNTGGMGAYSPAPVVTASVHDHIMLDIVQPTVQGMAAEGNRYSGFLYVGLMIDSTGQARVVEYNCRFGDPETQPILMRLQSDFTVLIEAALRGQLRECKAEWDPRAAIGVVMAAGGYPNSYRKGDAISGLDQVDADVKVFHAGTQHEGGNTVTNGGRVLCVTAIADSVHAAQQKCYDNVSKIAWPNAYYRSDIGYRAVARET
ncbi:MAG: phosphoribosylamine--glycine ligase [Pseudomonadales bacterium]